MPILSCMRIATWNVNSIRVRLERVVCWLERHQPDVLCLQELKTPDEQFPLEEFTRAEYHSAVAGQRTYNGVAILSKEQPDRVTRGLQGDSDDRQARLISADIAGIRILSAYVPNGARVGSDKWEYKLRWLERLRTSLEALDPDQPLALCGDLNVALRDVDVARPDAWSDTVLFHPEARSALRNVCEWGLVDPFAKLHPGGGIYSWWDYRRGAFHRNDGLRIDHILTTASLGRRARSAWVDRDQRKGSKDDKPSDHAPMVVEFDWLD